MIIPVQLAPGIHADIVIDVVTVMYKGQAYKIINGFDSGKLIRDLAVNSFQEGVDEVARTNSS